VQDEAQDEWVKEVSGATAVYAAMLSATVAGQLGGMGVNLFLGARHLWLPIALSVALEALAGDRAGATHHGRPLTPREGARLSITYSVGLTVLSLFLGLWILVARPGGSPGFPALPLPWFALVPALCLGAVGLTALRWALMRFFALAFASLSRRP
jgi:hypothetical protein